MNFCLYISFISQGSCNNVSTMRQEIKALDRQIKSLINFFHTHIKLKGEPSCADTIALVNHHLETRTCCRFIHQDLQVFLIYARIFLRPK